jgi:hypothetical protein
MYTPVALGTNFSGISGADVGGNPPNVTIAVGPTDILTATIWRIEMFDVTGKPIEKIENKLFFNLAGTGDPDDSRVIYNPFAREFLCAGISAIGFVARRSIGPMPPNLDTGWYPAINYTTATDTIWIGYNADGYGLTFGTPLDQLMLLPNGSNTYKIIILPPAFAGGAGMCVCRQPDAKSGDPLWLVRMQGGLQILEVANPFTAQVFTTYLLTNIPAHYPYADAQQPAGGTPIKIHPKTSANLFFQGPPNVDAIVRRVNGTDYMFVVEMGGAPPGGGVTQIFWYIVNLATQAIYQQGVIYDPNISFFNHSVSADAQGNMAITFSGSGSGTYLTHYVGIKSFTDTLFTYLTAKQNPYLLKGGRAGDYSTTAQDPSNGSFWSINQVTDPNGQTAAFDWLSNIQQFLTSAPPPPPPPQVYNLSGPVSMTDPTGKVVQGQLKATVTLNP